MNLPALTSFNSNLGISREIIELQNQMEVLQRQLATGKKADSYGGLGQDRLLVLSLQTRISSVDSFQKTIDMVQIRLDAVQQHLDRVHDIAAETRTDVLLPDYNSLNAGKTTAQLAADARLDEMFALLNLNVGGRYLFSGRTTDTRPVVSVDQLLNGDGTAAGFNQIVDERRQADLGASGLGRVAVTSAAPAVSLSEDVAGHPFGLKLASATGTLSGTTVAGPAGAPATIDVTFSAALPQEGENVRLTFDLPDGTQEVIELTATTASPPEAGEFTIGADENATAANFEAALNASVQTLAETKLESASAMAAAQDFFYYDSANPPQRIDGPPFDSAVALRDATATDTLLWYQGDNGPGSPRDTAIAHVDDDLDIAYGARANEHALTTVVSSLAVLASQTFDEADPNDKERYSALTSRVTTAVNFQTGQSVENLIVELGFKQVTLNDASERHTSAQQISLDLLQGAEQVDNYEVSAKLLQLQTQLQASYQTTALVSNLSLVNFL
ncbi:MAG: flagellar biosynthesis protein FlgL [Hyphomicrobiales bacterium]